MPLSFDLCIGNLNFLSGSGALWKNVCEMQSRSTNNLETQRDSFYFHLKLGSHRIYDMASTKSFRTNSLRHWIAVEGSPTLRWFLLFHGNSFSRSSFCIPSPEVLIVAQKVIFSNPRCGAGAQVPLSTTSYHFSWVIQRKQVRIPGRKSAFPMPRSTTSTGVIENIGNWHIKCSSNPKTDA